MLGLKESKVAIFDLIYHIWDGISGHAWIDNEEEYERDYILGLGVEELAHAMHDPVEIDLLDNEPLEVWLEEYQNGLDGDTKWIFNKNLVNGIFSNPVDKITDEDADDINLYAKWVQAMYRVENSLNPDFETQEANIDEVYSWDSGFTLVEMI